MSEQETLEQAHTKAVASVEKLISNVNEADEKFSQVSGLPQETQEEWASTKEALKDIERKDITAASQAIESARNHLQSVIAQVEKHGGSTADLRGVLQDLNTQTVTTAKDVGTALEAAAKAERDANSKEGQELLAQVGGFALGAAAAVGAGASALFAGLVDKNTINGLKSMVGTGAGLKILNDGLESTGQLASDTMKKTKEEISQVLGMS